MVTAALSAEAQTEYNTWRAGVGISHLYDLYSPRFDSPLAIDPQGLNGGQTSFDLGADIYVEKMFTPLIGARIGVRFGSMTGANEVEYYRNHFSEWNLDALLNLSQIDPDRIGSSWVLGISGGIGNGRFEAERNLAKDQSFNGSMSDKYWITRLGGHCFYRISPSLRLEFLIRYNVVLNDGFDGFNYSSGQDVYLSSTLGVSYLIGNRENADMGFTNYFSGDYIHPTASAEPQPAVVVPSLQPDSLDQWFGREIARLSQQTGEQSLRLDSLENTPALPAHTETRLFTYFTFGSSELDETAMAEIVYGLENFDYDQIEIVGFTDASGPRSFNEALALERARAVETFIRAYRKDETLTIRVTVSDERLNMDDRSFLDRKAMLIFRQ